jgi:hypothetical protein
MREQYVSKYLMDLTKANESELAGLANEIWTHDLGLPFKAPGSNRAACVEANGCTLGGNRMLRFCHAISGYLYFTGLYFMDNEGIIWSLEKVLNNEAPVCEAVGEVSLLKSEHAVARCFPDITGIRWFNEEERYTMMLLREG